MFGEGGGDTGLTQAGIFSSEGQLERNTKSDELSNTVDRSYVMKGSGVCT